ncbi:unnamed protein product [Protopolystoma xenopodis]|uniref:Uncharacterized protein n=1 Tax=Protopolystoma xenopodis TaxID=117903 RepID=A0A3S5BUA1_9PLAT|nr:unnamed protein product [Protopolystoma xenopodis]
MIFFILSGILDARHSWQDSGQLGSNDKRTIIQSPVVLREAHTHNAIREDSDQMEGIVFSSRSLSQSEGVNLQVLRHPVAAPCSAFPGDTTFLDPLNEPLRCRIAWQICDGEKTVYAAMKC